MARSAAQQFAALIFSAACLSAYGESAAQTAAIHSQIDQLIQQEAAKEVERSGLADCRAPVETSERRLLVARHFTSSKTKDIFVFFAMGGFGCGGNNWSNAVAVFTSKNGSHQLLSHAFVDGLLRRIEPGFLLIQGQHFYLRSDAFDDRQHMQDFGRKKIFVRVTLEGTALKVANSFFVPQGSRWTELQCPLGNQICR